MSQRPLSDVTVCRIPGRMPETDAAAYQGLREAHCGQKHASDECSGRIIIDRNGMTLACPICGDARALYPSKEPAA